jgi:preprotein translocase subunit SecG
MVTFLLIQIVLSVSLISVVLVQSGTGGLGATFGGSSTYHTKRGVEKSLFILTIALAVLFTLSSLFILVFQTAFK